MKARWSPISTSLQPLANQRKESRPAKVSSCPIPDHRPNDHHPAIDSSDPPAAASEGTQPIHDHCARARSLDGLPSSSCCDWPLQGEEGRPAEVKLLLLQVTTMTSLHLLHLLHLLRPRGVDLLRLQQLPVPQRMSVL
ncbi:hypothetical protein EYF80_046941 [Liparis tanakae]|uniref:Uncharacterized protein n=1 Tax=Liparis tanakae TaxID=230148 RepID=A0A4Z2FPS9_9TELE|nr:hypothetical protein EYF80_046941 [Liparis tanakae]